MDYTTFVRFIPGDALLAIKGGLALISFFGIIIKIQEVVSQKIRRDSLKTAVDIYSLIKDDKLIDAEELAAYIAEEVSLVYTSRHSRRLKFSNFVFGIVIFVGFFMWSTSLFFKFASFSPWVIVTAFVSAAGLALILDPTQSKVAGESSEFYRISFYNRSSFVIGVALTSVFSIVSVGLVYYQSTWSWWYMLIIIMLFVGTSAISQSMKFGKERDYQMKPKNI